MTRKDERHIRVKGKVLVNPALKRKSPGRPPKYGKWEFDRTPDQDEVIVAVERRMTRDRVNHHTITMVFEVMTEELGYHK